MCQVEKFEWSDSFEVYTGCSFGRVHKLSSFITSRTWISRDITCKLLCLGERTKNRHCFVYNSICKVSVTDIKPEFNRNPVWNINMYLNSDGGLLLSSPAFYRNKSSYNIQHRTQYIHPLFYAYLFCPFLLLRPLPIYVTALFTLCHFRFNALWLVYLHIFKSFLCYSNTFSFIYAHFLRKQTRTEKKRSMYC